MFFLRAEIARLGHAQGRVAVLTAEKEQGKLAFTLDIGDEWLHEERLLAINVLHLAHHHVGDRPFQDELVLRIGAHLRLYDDPA